MTCRWCGNENLLDRPMCPHCGEDVKRLEEAFGPEEPVEEPAEPPAAAGPSDAAMVVQSLVISAVVFVVLLFSTERAYSNWPETLWPRSVPTSEPTGPGEVPPSSVPPDAAPRCVAKGEPVITPSGEAFDRWYCDVSRPGDLYQEPDTSSVATGYLREQSSWFACQTQGMPNSDGDGSTWLYTQGDDHYSDDGWGYFPAARVNSAWATGPVPDIPNCTP